MAERAPVVTVIGVGNPDRGDDGVGRAVVRRLAAEPPVDAQLLEQDGEATALLDALARATAAYLVDASWSGARAGTIERFDVARSPLPADRWTLSSHGLGLADALELARALGQLPPRCIVYAIEGRAFEPGAALSAEVAAAVAAVAAEIRAEIVGVAGLRQPGIVVDASRRWNYPCDVE